MKRQVTAALLAAGTALAISAATAVPATAATSRPETFSGTIVTSGVSGIRTVNGTTWAAPGRWPTGSPRCTWRMRARGSGTR